MKVKDKIEQRTFTVLISDQISEEGLQPLFRNESIKLVFEPLTSTSLPLKQIDALLIRSATQVTKEYLEQMENLKIIGRAGVGTDNIDLNAATKRGVVVVNAPEGNTISTAEHTFAMMISLLRNIPQADASMKQGKWERKSFQGTELFGKTIGIIGFGRIGTELAKRANAFQMKVLAYDPFLTNERADKHKVKASALEKLLEESDIITVHTPLTKDTKGIINEAAFKRMKSGVYILNCARGGIIDEKALESALSEGHVRGAAIDVYEKEPAVNHPLSKFPQVITTPHIAASTTEAQLHVAEQVSQEVAQFLEGQPAIHAVNLPYFEQGDYEQYLPVYKLTKTMGEIGTQLSEGPVKQIDLSYAGEISHQNTNFFNRSFLCGFFENQIDSYVNEVNAPLIAKERGIQVSEKHLNDSKGYSNLIQADLSGEFSGVSIYGTYHKEFGARIIQLNDFQIDFQPQKHNLFIQHNDQPGVIGKVGQLLGTHGINIGTMQVGRRSEGGRAIMLLAIDKVCDREVIESFRTIEEIYSVSPLELSVNER